MTLTEIAYNILDIINGGQSTNNEYYSLEQIRFQILYYRALFLRRDATHDLDLQHHEQELSLTMDVVPTAEDRNSVELSDFLTYLLRSTTQIPETVAVRNTYDLTYVGTPGFKAIPLARFYQLKHLAHERFTACTPRSFVRDRYLYVINDPGVTEIAKAAQSLASDPTKIPMAEAVVRGVFADPRDVTDFDEDVDLFPIAPDMVQRITDGLLKGELQFMRGTETVTDLNIVPDEKEG